MRNTACGGGGEAVQWHSVIVAFLHYYGIFLSAWCMVQRQGARLSPSGMLQPPLLFRRSAPLLLLCGDKWLFAGHTHYLEGPCKGPRVLLERLKTYPSRKRLM